LESLFYNLELWPIAYFVITMWVVCSGVLAKILAGRLIDATPKPLKPLLSRRINVTWTGDHILDSLFESRVLADTHRYIRFALLPHLNLRTRISLPPMWALCSDNRRERLFPGKYWSGCPPKLAR
jgi:hypothetical protein